MNPTLFIVAITAYLLSVVGTLTGSFFSRFISGNFLKVFFIIHLLLIPIWLFLRKENDDVLHPGLSNYLFLAFVCSGLFVSAIVVRKQYPSFIKGYFILFLLTIPVFIVAPSRLLGFITTGNFTAVHPQKFHLKSNYYLVELPGKTPANSYKLIREMGIFHKTLARDIILPSNTDSIRLRDFRENETASIRVFSTNSGIDSIDLNIPLTATQSSSGTITKRPTKTP